MLGRIGGGALKVLLDVLNPLSETVRNFLCCAK
jgi:hypothetical protein